MATATYTDLKNSIIDRVNTEHLPVVEEGEEFGSIEITEETAESLNRTMSQELTVDTEQIETLCEELGLKIDLAQWVTSEPTEMIATHLDANGVTVVPVTANLSIDENYTLTYDASQKFLSEFINHWAEQVSDNNRIDFKKDGQLVITDWDSRDAYITSLLNK